MTNPYYAHTSGVPATLTRAASSQIRNEYDLIEDGLDSVETAIGTKAAHAGQVYTGAHDFTAGTTTVASPAALDDTTKAANTSWVQANIPTAVTTALASYAPLSSPALTGTPTAPTATTGTSTTQIATTAFVGATAFNAALPSQTGNNGKFVTTDGANASWAEAVTPTGTQTLTNKTLTGYTETVYALSGTVIDSANGTIQTKTLAANTTFTESLADGQSVILGITAGAYSVTLPAGATWAKVGGGGTAPTLISTGVNWITLWQAGGTLYGSFLGTT